jgi:hypothetical protein
MFNPVNYMQTLHGQLKLTAEKYKFCRVSGVSDLEEVLDSFKREKFFFAVEDAQNGLTFRGAGGTYFERRQYTVYVIGRAEYGNMDQRAEILAEAKAIFRSILTKLIKDKLTIPVLSAENIRFLEVPPAFAFGASGLYFMFTVENPVNLVYDATAWND